MRWDYFICIVLVSQTAFSFGSSSKRRLELQFTLGADTARMMLVSGLMKIYDQLLLEDPGNLTLRQRYTDILLNSGQEVKALVHLRFIDASEPPDPDRSKLIGEIEESIKNAGRH